METTFWAALHGTPAGLGIALVSLTLQLGFLMANTHRITAVKGTRQRYIAATWATSLAGPSLLAAAVDTVMDFFAGDWFGVVVGMLVLFVVALNWRQLRNADDDNWWKGRGTKIGKSVRSFLTAPPQVRAAGSNA